MITGHGGNTEKLAAALDCPVHKIIDMSSNLNPLGPPENINNIICDNLDKIQSLPEPDAISMRKGFAKFYKIDPEQVIAGNGTTWFIYTIPKALGSKKALIAGPTYSDYKDACLMYGTKFNYCFAENSNQFEPDIDKISHMAEDADTIFICNPNNPTGSLILKNKLEYLIKKHTNTIFVIDESYLPFVDRAEDISMAADLQHKNLIVLSSMSKIFRIPGLRTGFLSGSKNIVAKIMAHYQPWSVNAIAQAVIKNIFDYPEKIKPFYQKTRIFIKREREIFCRSLQNLPKLQLIDSNTYFILAYLANSISSREFSTETGKHRILIRDCANFNGLSNKYIRFSLKSRQDNLKLADLIKQILN
jgi:threonine-phosphate decarboxylase